METEHAWEKRAIVHDRPAAPDLNIVTCDRVCEDFLGLTTNRQYARQHSSMTTSRIDLRETLGLKAGEWLLPRPGTVGQMMLHDSMTFIQGILSRGASGCSKPRVHESQSESKFQHSNADQIAAISVEGAAFNCKPISNSVH